MLILWKCCHGYPHSSANGHCLASLHCMQIIAMLTSSSCLPLFTTVTSKCLISINEFVCAMGEGFCCTCFTGGETETHVFLASHCGMNCTVRTRAQDLQNVLPYVQGTKEETTEITSTERFCFHSIWSTKARQTFMGPLLPVYGPWRGSGLPAQLTSTAYFNLSRTED